MKVKDIIAPLEELAPLNYAESFDNVGLLVGDAEQEVTGVLITLLSASTPLSLADSNR